MTDPFLLGIAAVIGVGVPAAVVCWLVRRWGLLPDSTRLRTVALASMFLIFAAPLIPEPLRNWVGPAGWSIGEAWLVGWVLMAGLCAALGWAAERRENWLAYRDERAHNGGVAPRRLFSVGTTALLAFLTPWGLVIGMAAVARLLVPNGWLDSLSTGLDPNNAELATFVQRVLTSTTTGLDVGLWVLLATSLLLATVTAAVQWARHRRAQHVYTDDLRLQAERDQRVLDGTQLPYGTPPSGAVPVAPLPR